MAFTDVEMAILSCSAYYTLKNTDKATRLYDFINRIKDSLSDYLGKEYEEVLPLFLEKIKNDGSRVVAQRNDKVGTGFSAYAIADSDNNLTFVVRGTEDITWSESCKKDIIADLQLAYRYCTDQQGAMRDFVSFFDKDCYSGYNFVGHSLGGNLAMFGAIMCVEPQKVLDCVTFNAPGFNKSFCKKYAEKISAVQRKIRNYQNECDGLSNAFAPVGELILLECKGWDGFHKDGLSAHFVNRLLIENGEFVRNRTGIKDLTMCGAVIDTVTFVTDNTVKPKDADKV